MKKKKTLNLNVFDKYVSSNESDSNSKLDKHIAETELLFEIILKRLDRIEKMIESTPKPIRHDVWIKED